MAKKTLSDLKKCPIDFLYLWASEDFISALGSKAKIIRQKKYNQQQMLWKTMAENEKYKTSSKGQVYYQQWAEAIGQAIEDTYGITPVEILRKLAMGETVVGKDFSKGVYGVGETPSTAFVQNSNYQVNSQTGQIMAGDGGSMKDVLHQNPIYGSDGQVTGYSCVIGGVQYQSTYDNGQYVSFSYSNADGVQTAKGGKFDSAKGTFWQNANNYMPIINSVLSWLTSIVNTYFPSNTILTSQNTAPSQTEWVETEKDGNGGTWLAGGLLVAGAAALFLGKDKKNKNKK